MTIREIKSRKHKEYEQNRKDIYYFIVKYEKRKGEMPQIKTIAEELDLSPSAVQRHLRQFADDGLIEFSGSNSHRKYRLIRMQKYISYLPDGQSAQNAVQDLMNTVVVAVNTNVIVRKNIMCIQLIFRL